MAEKLRREFIELMEKDVEFRYTVAGYLGLSDILRRLDNIEKNIQKLWEEVKSLREGQEKLWEGQEKLWEGQKKLWEGQEKLWEGQKKLWEGQEKLWEEVKALREGQQRLWESQQKLWEGQEKLWEEQRKMREEQRKMREYIVSGFRDLRRALGVTFEEHAASFLEVMLMEMGYPNAVVEKKYLVEDGNVVEIDMFCEEPLVVGEATLSITTVEEARREVDKLMKRVELAEKIYKKKALFSILSVARATPEANEELKTLSEKYKTRIILGREMEEQLAI